MMNVTMIKVLIDGRHVVVRGRAARALLELFAARDNGCSYTDNPPAPRWAGYIYQLRRSGITVETVRERHGGRFAGQHAPLRAAEQRVSGRDGRRPIMIPFTRPHGTTGAIWRVRATSFGPTREQLRTAFWSARQVVAKRRRLNRRIDAPHVRLYRWQLDSPAYLSLTCQARAVLIEIARVYDGLDNGRIGLSIRRASARCNIARGTAARTLIELQERGFIECMTKGGFNRKSPHASEWRLTFWPCDGDPPTKEFMSWGREK